MQQVSNSSFVHRFGQKQWKKKYKIIIKKDYHGQSSWLQSGSVCGIQHSIRFNVQHCLQIYIYFSVDFQNRLADTFNGSHFDFVLAVSLPLFCRIVSLNNRNFYECSWFLRQALQCRAGSAENSSAPAATEIDTCWALGCVVFSSLFHMVCPLIFCCIWLKCAVN